MPFHIFLFTAPDFDRSQWLNEKFKLGLDFPNVSTGEGRCGDGGGVPVYTDGISPLAFIFAFLVVHTIFL